MTHDLKTWEQYFQDIWDGVKTFEVRKDDRGYQIGDYLMLMEFLNEESNLAGHDIYTNRKVMCRVDYILRGGQFGIEPDCCVMIITVKEKFE